MSLAIFFLVILLLATGIAALLGRHFRWSIRRQVWVTIGLSPLVLVCIVVLWAVGLLGPLQYASMQWKPHALERALYIGETRTHVEQQFGTRIPLPDQRSLGYEGTNPSPTNEARESHFVRYYYLSTTALCFAGYDGIEVQYDVHDRVQGWRPAKDATGC